MKYQILLSGKKRKSITDLSSAELSKRVVNVQRQKEKNPVKTVLFPSKNGSTPKEKKKKCSQEE